MFWLVIELTTAWVVMAAVVMGMLRAAARADEAAADQERELIVSLRRLAAEQLRETPGLAVGQAAGRARPLH